ncbi:hypothetical protein [Exiguobacterium sp. s162]|uniref:hypothetical protein n=1 Tax=Exiguobacterium sp. s162 TaxID=2751276 RepID=UPI001BE7B6C0|nr:hypothetical protein [Exiguobacterium sp. s162]
MGQRIEGFITKKAILHWLENYSSLRAGDRPVEEVIGSGGGPKSPDGITNSTLNQIMLDQAIENLPPLTRAICKARWVYQFPRRKTMKTLMISEGVYNQHRRAAVDLIYRDLNGEMVNYSSLLDKISGKT